MRTPVRYSLGLRQTATYLGFWRFWLPRQTRHSPNAPVWQILLIQQFAPQLTKFVCLLRLSIFGNKLCICSYFCFPKIFAFSFLLFTGSSRQNIKRALRRSVRAAAQGAPPTRRTLFLFWSRFTKKLEPNFKVVSSAASRPRKGSAAPPPPPPPDASAPHWFVLCEN